MNPTLSQIQAAAQAGRQYIQTTPTSSGQKQVIAYLKGIEELAAYLISAEDVRSEQMRLFLENTRILHTAPKEQEN